MIDEQSVTVTDVTVTEDKYGNRTKGTATRTVVGCLFAPAGSLERTSPDVPAVTTNAAVYFPGGTTPPNSDSKVTVDGTDYAVEGEPAVWGSAGVVVELKKWGK